MVSSKFWNNLSQKNRVELDHIFQEITAERNHLSARINQQNRQRILDAGGTVRVLSDLQRGTWVAAMKPVWDLFKDEIGTDIIDAALESNQ